MVLESLINGINRNARSHSVLSSWVYALQPLLLRSHSAMPLGMQQQWRWWRWIGFVMQGCSRLQSESLASTSFIHSGVIRVWCCYSQYRYMKRGLSNCYISWLNHYIYKNELWRLNENEDTRSRLGRNLQQLNMIGAPQFSSASYWDKSIPCFATASYVISSHTTQHS